MNKCVQLALISFSSLLYFGCSASAPKRSTVAAQPRVVKSQPTVKATNPKALKLAPVENFERISTPMFGEKSESLVISSATWVLATPFADGNVLD